MTRDAPPPSRATCSICQTDFTSRNRLFDHLRTDHAEQWDAMNKSSASSTPAKRFRSKVAVRFGYDAHDVLLLQMNAGQSEEGANSIAASLLQPIFVEVFAGHLSGGSVIENSICVHNTSLASEAKERPSYMAQDTDCGAASDAMVLDCSYETCGRRPLRLNAAALRESMNDHLLKKSMVVESGVCDVPIRVLSVVEPVPKAKLHAERSATQRAYHYLLPMYWLDGGREAAEWYVRTGKVSIDQCDERWRANAGPDVNDEAPPAIARLKSALKSIESPMRFGESRGSNADVSDMSTRGRFGALGQRWPQSFHNYLPEHLGKRRGQVGGPFATIDRVKVVDLLPVGSDTVDGSFDVVAVVEFRGDNFVRGQILRLISEIIAMVNRHISSDLHQMAMSLYCEVDIPVAPSERLYAAETKYHFYEQAFGPLFPSEDELALNDWKSLLRSKMLSRLGNMELKTEQAWLKGHKTAFATIKTQRCPCSEQDKQQTNIKGSATQSSSINLDIRPKEVPLEYRPVLSMLRDLVSKEQWPPTSLLRTRTIRSPHGADGNAARGIGRGKKTSAYSGQKFQFGSFVLDRKGRDEDVHADLATVIFELESKLIEQYGIDRSPSTHCSISHNVEFTPSCQKANSKATLIVGLGDFAGGEVVVGNDSFDIRYKPQEYCSRNSMVSTAPFRGERFELCWFSLEMPTPVGHSNENSARAEDGIAKRLALKHDDVLPNFNPLKIRPNSTDALVVNEILGEKEYEYHEADFDFSVHGHDCVLDIGAHIGVFTRYALCNGATHVILYEPEPSNFELLRHNTTFTFGSYKINARECAVAHGKEGTAKLIGGKDRSDGVSNTWRHSLDVCSSLDENRLGGVEHEVEVVHFFNGALREGTTFVKIDAEGAELDILLSSDASVARSWLDVTHLVLEYSFTKERRVSVFHQATSNLTKAGFKIRYEGMGAWWDTELGAIWPYHNDLVVFAMRDKNYE